MNNTEQSNLLSGARKTISTLPYTVVTDRILLSFFIQTMGSLALVCTPEDLKLKVPDAWATNKGEKWKYIMKVGAHEQNHRENY